MKVQSLLTTSLLFSLTVVSACDDTKDAKSAAPAEGAKSAENAESKASGAKLEALHEAVKKGAAFDEALATVEKEMGKSPLQQGEFWNFGEYDAAGACLHMVLVRSGDKVQQVQFTKYEPGSSGFGWCVEMKIEKS